MTSVKQKHYAIQGSMFGARGCSCSCNPCDCDPCSCDNSSYPTWRVSGFYVTTGVIRGVDVSGLLVLSLAQPLGEESQAEWREIILVDDKASVEQNAALVEVFEKRFDSIPAEVNSPRKLHRAVYSVPMRYNSDGKELTISLILSPETVSQMRENAEDQSTALHRWEYTGPLVLREQFELHSA